APGAHRRAPGARDGAAIVPGSPVAPEPAVQDDFHVLFAGEFAPQIVPEARLVARDEEEVTVRYGYVHGYGLISHPAPRVKKESGRTEAAERPLSRPRFLRQPPGVPALVGLGLVFFVIVLLWLRRRRQCSEESIGADDGAAGTARRVPHRPVRGHDGGARAELTCQAREHVVGLVGRAREDHLDLAARGARARRWSAVEDHREAVALCPRDVSDEAEQRRPPGLEALRLVRPEVGVATDDVVAVDEPAHQRGRGGPRPPVAWRITWPRRR